MPSAPALSPVPIRPFSGEDSYTVEEFLVTVDYVATPPRSPGSLFAYLEGRARFWLTHYAGANAVPAGEAGYAELRQRLLEEFSLDPGVRDPRDPYRAFRALTQYTAGVHEYADAYRRRARELRYDTDNHFNRMWWVLGLRRDIREALFERLPMLYSFRETVAEAAWIESGRDGDAVRAAREREPRESRDARDSRDSREWRESKESKESVHSYDHSRRRRHGHESGETLDLSRIPKTVHDTIKTVVDKAKDAV